MKNVVAYTKVDPIYPGFINFTPADDGGVTIHLRGDPTQQNGAYVCGYSNDQGLPGRCSPGDENCNNYCNLAPSKGPMQPRPKPCQHTKCGDTTSLVLSAAEWASLKDQILGAEP